MFGLEGRRLALAIGAVVLVAFGAGFGLARLTSSPASSSAAAANPGDVAWSLFGKPRPADAPRAAPKKPDGFTVWTSRLDSRGTAPSACIRMT